jgi:hypothetical protein
VQLDDRRGECVERGVHELEPRAHLVALGDDLVEHPIWRVRAAAGVAERAERGLVGGRRAPSAAALPAEVVSVHRYRSSSIRRCIVTAREFETAVVRIH